MVTYRTSGAWGIGKGGSLLPVEIDRNFNSIDERIAAAWDTTVAADIDLISITGSQILFALRDGRTLGPFFLPFPTLTWRGDFANAVAYLANDMLATPDAIYLVLQDHSGVAPFDPDREISAEPVYSKVFEGDREFFDTVVDLIATNETAILGLSGRYIRCDGVTDVTIPPNADEAFPVGELLTFRCVSTPLTEFLPGSGVTITAPTGFLPEAAFVGAVVHLVKVDTNAWDIFGDLAV